MTPAWTLTADGADLTAKLKDSLLGITVIDQGGLEADEMEVSVADPRAELAMPRLGAVVSVALGYRESGLLAFGQFVADTIELSSPPRTLTIRGHAADITGSLLTRKTKDWEDTTLGQIVSTIAAQHGLVARVGVLLQGRPIRRIDQTTESDVSFLTRLGQLYDAIVTVKDGKLLFTSRGKGTSVSGTALTAIALTPAEVTEWRLSLTQQAVATTVTARVYDPATASRQAVEAKRPAALPASAKAYASAFSQAEARDGLPAGLLAGLAEVESAFNPSAISPAGAKGLMQFMPATAARFGLANPLDPRASIAAAGRYLQWLLAHYNGNLDHAIRAYNAGEGAVDRWLAGKATLPSETARFLPKVQAAQKKYASGTGPNWVLRQTFQDAELARTAAESKASALTRGASTLSLTLPGRPALVAETPVTLAGFAPEFDGQWIITTAIHTIDGAGYVTRIEAERA